MPKKTSDLLGLPYQGGNFPNNHEADIMGTEYWRLSDDDPLIACNATNFGSGWMDFLGLAFSSRAENPRR
jgi:hypothetical protein